MSLLWVWWWVIFIKIETFLLGEREKGIINSNDEDEGVGNEEPENGAVEERWKREVFGDHENGEK